MKGHLNDPIHVSKGQLMEFINLICENYKLTNYARHGGDISYDLGARDAIDGLREEICREVLEL